MDPNPNFFNFLDDGARDHRHFPRGAAIQHSSHLHLNEVLRRTLGDLSLTCPNCGGICPDHSINLRDAFMKRLGILSQKIAEGVDLYFRNRSFGIPEPSEVIPRIYDLAAEHSFVYALAEPEDGGIEIEEETEGEREEE